eukprot:1342990-Amorphochlora_amoeboformis.AAC.1
MLEDLCYQDHNPSTPPAFNPPPNLSKISKPSKSKPSRAKTTPGASARTPTQGLKFAKNKAGGDDGGGGKGTGLLESFDERVYRSVYK